MSCRQRITKKKEVTLTIARHCLLLSYLSGNGTRNGTSRVCGTNCIDEILTLRRWDALEQVGHALRVQGCFIDDCANLFIGVRTKSLQRLLGNRDWPIEQSGDTLFQFFSSGNLPWQSHVGDCVEIGLPLGTAGDGFHVS